MRECIFCGRKLEAGEKCSCAHAVARRKAKEAEMGNGAHTEENPKKKDNKKIKKEKVKKERYRKSKERNYGYSSGIGSAFADFKRLLISFIKSPVETIMNPGEMSKAVIFIFVILEGIIGGMCVYAVTTGAGRGPIRLLGSMMGFAGVEGYNHIRGFVLSALSGAISGILVFFIYSGVFYLVNKFIFKLFTPYWEFVKRFSFVAIPLTLIGAVGVVLGFFSIITFTILLFCGIIGAILMTYEILRCVWYQVSTTKLIYTTMLCIFVIVTILMNLMRFA